MAEPNKPILEIGESKQVIHDPLAATAPKGFPPDAAKIMGEFYGLSLHREPTEVEQEIQQGMEQLLRSNLNGQADVKKAATIEDGVRAAIAASEDPQEYLNRIRENNMFAQYSTPDVSVLLEGGDLSDQEVRFLDRTMRLQRLIDVVQEESSTGVSGIVGDFADIAVSDALHSLTGGVLGIVGVGEDTFENATNRTELARELVDLVFSDIDPDEFDRRAAPIIARVGDAGFFTQSNQFFVHEFIEMVREGGEGRISQGAEAFQVLDVATAGIGGAIVKGAGRLGALPRKVTQVVGRKNGVETIERAAAEAASGRPSKVLAETEPGVTRMADADSRYLAGPEVDGLRQAEAPNHALNAIRLGDKPSFVDPRLLKAKMDDIVEDIKLGNKAQKRHELDVNVYDDGLGNIIGRVVLGKSDRSLYTNPKDAQKLADKVGGEVRETVEAGKVKYVVVKEQNINVEGIARATSLREVKNGFLSTFTSTTRATSEYLNGILKWGESVNAARMREIGKQYRAATSKVSKQELGYTNEVFRRLQNDPDYSWIRGPLSRSEFIREYTKISEGVAPSDEALDYWRAVQNLNDADYYLNADAILKDAVRNNETMVRMEDGNFYRSKTVTLPAGSQVYDESLKRFRYLKESEQVFEVKDFAYVPEGVGAVQYVSRPNAVTRRLFHTDVLEYNTGGHRFYEGRTNWFLKQEGTIVLGSGEEVARQPKTFMGVRSEQEAKAAEEAWNKISAAVARNDENLDDIIRANNEWNPNITDRESFLKFAEEQGLRPNQPISRAADGASTARSSGDTRGAGQFAGERTVGGGFRNSYANRMRKEKPLIGYGGDPLATMSPIRAMEKGFTQALNRSADRAYLNRAAQGLLRTVEKLESRAKAGKGETPVSNWADLQGLSVADTVARMEFKPGEVGDKLRAEQATILRVLNRQTPDLQYTQRALNSAADFVFGRRQAIERLVGKKATEKIQKGVDLMAIKDYTGALRSVAFHSKLGLFSPDQLLVQSTQAINATAISSATLGTANALRAASGTMPLQIAINVSEEVAQGIAQRQATVTGVSPEDFMMIREWVIRNGRGIIDRTAVEENRDAVISAGIKTDLANASTVFFRTGEVSARMTAAMLNMAELRKAGFKGDIFSDSTTRRMMHRQDVLTASMTAKSAANWQRGMLSIPFQFMTYNVRLIEQIFTSDVLTGAERTRLAMTHLFLYGGASFPLVGRLMDEAAYDGHYDPSTKGGHAVRYGMLDAALSTLTEAAGGEKTALSTRIGVGDGLFQFAEDTGTEGLMQLAIGPGGEILVDSVSSFARIMDGIFTESWDSTKYDAVRLARIASSFDDGYKLWLAATFGEYKTRNTGTVTMEGLSLVDGFLQAAGVPLAKQDQLWSTIDFEGKRKDNLEKTYKLIVERSRLVGDLLERDEHERAWEVTDDISALLQMLKPGERSEAIQRLKRDKTLATSVADTLMRNGRLDLADRIRKEQE